jgi:hypothetical protein
MQRAQDEYELAMARNVDSWGYSPPGRSAGDSPENRRRQARGRIGNSRAAHLLGRPTSVGSVSARWINPASTHGNIPQRMHGTNVIPVNPSFPHTPRRSVTPGLPRQYSGSSGSNSQTPTRSRALSGLSSSPPLEEVSPPVAVGSGLPRDRQVERHGEHTLHRNLDTSTGPSNAEWNSDPVTFMLNYQDPDHFNVGQSHRPRPNSNDLSSLQTFLDASHPLGQHPPSVTGIDTNRHQNLEPQRNIDIDDLPLLGNPQPRWSR